MLIKLAALGALGYLGYRYYQQNPEQFAPRRRSGGPEIALAGGPLSELAKIEPSDQPADDWPTVEAEAAPVSDASAGDGRSR